MLNRVESASAASALPLALVLMLAMAGPAAAQSEPSKFQRFLGSIGVLELPPENPPDYRERAPLVVPPSNSLIAPRNPGDVSLQNPDWPLDHDARGRRAKDVEAEKQADDEFYSGQVLGPDRLDRLTGKKLTKQEQDRRDAIRRRPEAQTAGDEYAAGRERYNPYQLGFKGWGAKSKEDTVVFTGEPERRSLTEPPAGLRTPSKDAPYGIVSSGPPKAKVITDRSASRDDPNLGK
jgi:hypothetical protein